MTHSLRIRDIVDTHLTRLFCNKEARIRIVLLKTIHFRISYFEIRFNDYKNFFLKDKIILKWLQNEIQYQENFSKMVK